MDDQSREDLPEVYPSVVNGFEGEEAVKGVEKMNSYLTSEALEIYLFIHDPWEENSSPNHGNYLFKYPGDFYSISLQKEAMEGSDWTHIIHRIAECERNGDYRDVSKTDVMCELFDIQKKLNDRLDHG